MIVTLDVYSGRENPSWELSEADGAKLIERVTRRAVKDAQAVDNVLGYRGFIIFAARDDDVPETLPASFRIGGQLPTGYLLPESIASALSSSEEDEVARFLLHTGREILEEGLGEFVDQQMRLQVPRKPTRITKDKALRALKPPRPCIIHNTPYNPGFWNRAAVQPYNNCYNYSMNWRSDTFAQPGRISGHQWTVISCANVGAAASWDGCTTFCRGSNKNVALVVAPGPGFIDYHWYRRHSEGFWGHKPGGTPARNTDNSGRVINGTTLTPANCNRGPYTIFCGYRFSPTGMRVR